MEGASRPTGGIHGWREFYGLGGISERSILRAKELLMQQVPGTYAMTWTEIQRLDLRTFDDLLSDKVRMIEEISKRKH